MTTRLVLFTLVFLGLGLAWGNAQVIYQYTNASSGAANYIDPNADFVPPVLARGDVDAALNLGCSGATEGFGATDWPTTNVFNVTTFNANGDFVEFTLTPDAGFGLKITGFSARSRRENLTGTADDGPIAMRYGYKVGTDPWVTVNPGNPQSSNLCNSGGVNRVWPGWVTLNISQPINFRIYGLSSGSNFTGDMFLRDIIVNGEVCASVPTISPAPANFMVCEGTTSFTYGYMTSTADNYSIDFDVDAEAEGFVDASGAISAPGSINWSIPANAEPGDYNATVIITNECGFESDYPVVITVMKLPDVSISMSAMEICENGSVMLTFTDNAATGHLFNITADLVDDNGITVGAIVYTGIPTAASDTYTESVDFEGSAGGAVALTNIEVTDQTTGCSTTLNDLNLVVNPLPTVTITGTEDSGIGENDGATCAGAEVTLTASGGVSYLWSTVETTAAITVSPLVTNTYTVTVTSVDGCTATSSFIIYVSPIPDASLSVDPSGPICPGTLIEVYFDEEAYLAGTQFTVVADVVPDVFNQSQLTFTDVVDGDHVDLTEGTDFTGDLSSTNIIVTEEVSGCAQTIAVGPSVDVLPAPEFEFMASTESDGPISGNNSGGPNTIDIDFCAGNHLTLADYADNGEVGYLVSFTTTGNVTYDGGGPLPLSSGPDDVSAANASTFFGSVYGGVQGYGLSSGATGAINQTFVPYLDNDNSGDYTTGDCTGEPMYLNYHIYAIPTVVATPSAAAVCNGDAVNVVFSGNYGSGVTYTWTGGNTDMGMDANGTGDISFTATNAGTSDLVANLTVTPEANGCTGTPVNFTITVHPVPVFSVTATVDGGTPQSANNDGGPFTIDLDFCSGQSFTYSNFNPIPNLCYIEEIVGGSGNLYYGSVNPGNEIPVTRAPQPLSSAYFLGSPYGPYLLGAMETYGYIDETFTPFYDANGNCMYDAGIDCLGEPITVHYDVYAPIEVAVIRNNSGEICSGDLVDYAILTTSIADVLVDITLEENSNAGNPADLEDGAENIFAPTQTITISSSTPGSFTQVIHNAIGTFDRGRVRFRVENARYADVDVCTATIGSFQQNTQVYPKPILTEPADLQIVSGETVDLDFDPLLNAAPFNANTAGFPIRVSWTATPTAGVLGSSNGTAIVYLHNDGSLAGSPDFSQTLSLAPEVCNGSVTYTFTPQSDGPNPGPNPTGPFDGNFCSGDPFDVVVNIVKEVTLEHVYTGGPVACGEEFTVSVEASNFCNISTLDYPFTWDPNMFQLVTYSPVVPQALATGFASVVVNSPGELYFSFFDDGNAPFGNDLPDGTVLFTYTLRAIGASGTYNIPDAAPMTEAYNPDFIQIPVSTIGVSVEIIPLSLGLNANPEICPSDDNAYLTFDPQSIVGNPTYYFIDFLGCPLFPNSQEGPLVVQDGQIVIPLPDNLQNGACNATLVVSNEFGCVSDEIPFSIIIDQEAPTVPTPAPITQQCFPAPLPNINVVIGADDNCTEPQNLVIAYEPNMTTTNGGSGCSGSPLVISRVYSVTDEAGNTTLVTQTITIEDNIFPTVSTDLANPWYPSLADAEAAALARANATKHDNCTPPVGINVSFATVSTQVGCTWTIHLVVTDACGNATLANYITVVDDEDPTIDDPDPLDDCYSVSDDPDAPFYPYQDAVNAAIAAITAVANDNCTDPEDLVITAVTDGTDCDLDIIVTVADACGRTTSYTYNTRVESEGPYIPADPLALNGACFDNEQDAIDAAIALTQDGAGDDCTSPNDLQYDAFVDGGCPASIMVVVTDYCGNPSMVTYTGVHIDTEDPVALGTPSQICFQALTGPLGAYAVLAADAAPTDNCTSTEDLIASALDPDGPTPPTFTPDDNDAPCQEGTVTLTFTDNCGNSIEVSFSGIIVDDEDPIAEPLADLEFACLDEAEADLPDTLLVIAGDNCGVESIEWISDELPTSCPGTGTRTYRVTDCAGNSIDVVQNIIVNDDVAPTFEPTPENDLDRSIPCGDEIALQAAQELFPVAEDNCGDVNIVKTAGAFVPSQECPQGGTYTNTWTAYDDCGNASEMVYTQTITVYDNEYPEVNFGCQFMPLSLFTSNGANCPNEALISLEVGDVIHPNNTWTVAGIEIPSLTGCILDNCASDEYINIEVVAITYGDNDLDCSRGITITFEISDACGNVNPTPFVCEYLIFDDVAPIWNTPEGAPFVGFDGNGALLGGINITIACDDVDALAFAHSLEPEASDECSDITLNKISGSFVTGGDCPQEGTITNTWTALDDCENVSVVFTQVITVIDNEAPEFEPGCQFMPLDLYTSQGYACPEDAVLSGLVVDQIIDNAYTWNVAGFVVPSLGGCIFDNCANSGDILVRVASIENVYNEEDCHRTITISFELSDPCGNVQEELFVCIYNIYDNTAPSVFCAPIPDGGGPALPDDCYSSVAAAEAAALEAIDPCDNCTATGDLDISVSTVGTCEAEVTVTVTDCAGNFSTYTFYTRIDSEGPILVPSTLPFNCYPTLGEAQAAAYSATTIEDNCSDLGNLDIAFSNIGNCPTTSITITATDECGNSNSVTYNGLCIGAGSSVQITNEADDLSVDCDGWQADLQAWLNNNGGAVATGSGVQWSFAPVDPQTVLEMSAPNCTTHSKSVTVTFTATDGCGYTDSSTATFTVTDNTAPTANLIANSNLTCSSAIPAQDVSVVTGEADNCGGTPSVAWLATSDNGAAGCPGSPRIVIHQYTVTDAYCNSTIVNQMITVVDNVAPSFTAPANITVEGCTSAVSSGVAGDVTNESDNCTPSGPGLQAFYTDVVANGPAGQNPKFTITRTWQLVDACGNAAIPRVQTITIQDVTAPTITGCPSNISIGGAPVVIENTTYPCAWTAPGNQVIPTPTIADNCGGVSLSYQLNGFYVGSGTGSGTINGVVFLEGTTTVTYIATDLVGNTATCTFTVTVNCLTISGRIIWDHDDVSGVKDATVNITSGAPVFSGSDLSDSNGDYDKTVPGAGTYLVKPVKNINRLNGVTSADASAILAHISAPAPGTILDPYKKVCADVNRSGIINSQDATLITQSIAGNPTALAIFNVFWRFTTTLPVLPATTQFVVPAINDSKSVVVTSSDVTGVDFLGMKIGDVASPWADPQMTPNLPLVWVVQDQTLVAGTEVTLDFAASNFKDLASYQMALDFDPSKLQFVGFQPLGAIPMNVLDNFGAYNANFGELRSVWAAGQGTTLADGTPVFRAKFKVLTSGQKLSQVLKLDESEIECKAFTAALTPADMKLVFTESVSTDTPLDLGNAELQLLQNRPNPFSDATTIGFILPEACEAHIRILDISGREIATYDRKYTAGYHELDFRMENAWTYGVMFCELVTPQGKRTIKMITAK